MIKILLVLTALILIGFAQKDALWPREITWQELNRIYFYESHFLAQGKNIKKNWKIKLQRAIPSKINHELLGPETISYKDDVIISETGLIYKYKMKIPNKEVTFAEKCKFMNENEKMLICIVECLDHNAYIGVKVYKEI